jgi:hypothetical protein
MSFGYETSPRESFVFATVFIMKFSNSDILPLTCIFFLGKHCYRVINIVVTMVGDAVSLLSDVERIKEIVRGIE